MVKKLKLKTIRVRQAQCCKCGWRWLPKKEQPQQCPKCHDRLWWQGHAYKTYKGTVHEVTAVRRTPKRVRMKPVLFACSACKSSGFEPSITGVGCTFCDGTEGGNPPELLKGTA